MLWQSTVWGKGDCTGVESAAFVKLFRSLEKGIRLSLLPTQGMLWQSEYFRGSVKWNVYLVESRGRLGWKSCPGHDRKGIRGRETAYMSSTAGRKECLRWGLRVDELKILEPLGSSEPFRTTELTVSPLLEENISLGWTPWKYFTWARYLATEWFSFSRAAHMGPVDSRPIVVFGPWPRLYREIQHWL